MLRESRFGLGDLPKFTYTRQVIEEAMRLYPPGWLMTRKARKDDQLGNYFVPAETEIYISPYIIQRHPAQWDHPDCFDQIGSSPICHEIGTRRRCFRFQPVRGNALESCLPG